MAAASRLPDPVGGALADSARDAFTLAFRSVEVLGAGAIAALAVASVLLLRHAALAPANR